MATLWLLLLVGLQLTSAQPIRVAAWNIEKYGRTKAKDDAIMTSIVKVVEQYDIIVIQEVLDNTPDLGVVGALMDRLNQQGPRFSYEESPRLGPSTYKERYLFVYKFATVHVHDKYQYPSAGFTRPPFVVRFEAINLPRMGQFVLIPQHTKPEKAVKEINHLYDVTKDVLKKWGIKNMLILGDFNADCDYVKKTDWPKIRLFTDKTLHWLIPDSADTTVAGRNCAYDRIVASNDMNKHVVSGSPMVYDFLTPKQAKKVSDHFPVEVKLQ